MSAARFSPGQVVRWAPHPNAVMRIDSLEILPDDEVCYVGTGMAGLRLRLINTQPSLASAHDAGRWVASQVEQARQGALQ